MSRIVDISPEDAFYRYKDSIIGLELKSNTLVEVADGWYFGNAMFYVPIDIPGMMTGTISLYFARVRVED